MKQNFTVRQGALDGVEAFLSVAQHRSFRRAAAQLGVTPSASKYPPAKPGALWREPLKGAERGRWRDPCSGVEVTEHFRDGTLS